MVGRRPPEQPSVAIVTDSTASLPEGAAERWGIGVVPLDVVVDGERHVEGVDLAPAELLEALTAGAKVSTSQPPPAAFAAAYARAAASGATEIVSLHLSGELSGTVRAARLAAETASVPVHVVDSRAVAMALGFAVLDAARFSVGPSAAGAPAPSAGPLGSARSWWRGRGRAAPGLPTGTDVAERGRAVAESARVWFLVDSLDHLRRGGRLSMSAAAIGIVLGLRPILTLQDGGIDVVEKVRTRRAARDRLVALAVEDVARRPAARVAVHHLGQPDLANALAAELTAATGAQIVEVAVCESSAVLAAHAGPGLLAIVVAG
ncbi:DegV family protein [Cellulomonas fengjieae]|uniref:DegV family protein n=1 Tax=Cellulomonas fengjieae TaxID=2819978 RepID=A0ABS3SE11_9CELL|nr:DegV family protein [Cellulomonas fengjieae]MBO3083977.1 DegV family protein [Cellulomonas fengjieae]QVI64755.1 DegV family protein [Cellulomonas fengjieae]